MSALILDVKNLSVSFGTKNDRVRVLHDVSLKVARGTALGVVGESGSGKSTTALAILGLLHAGAQIDAGEILLQGQDIYSLSDEERRQLRGGKISIVFQDPFTTLNPAIRVGKQISEPLIMHRSMSEEEAQKETLKLLREVGIHDPERMALSYPHQLSGGMKQRALIASALACDPELLILDEPTTALDVTVEAQILDLLDELRAKRNLSILFISHNLGVVSRVCENISVLYAGRVVEEGATKTVLSAPRHPYTKGLLASLPKLSTERNRLSPIPGRLPDLRHQPVGCVFEPRCHFAENSCKKPQSLISQDNGTNSRCRKSAVLSKTPWSEEVGAEIKRRNYAELAEKSLLINAQSVEKTFTTGGFFDGLSLKKGGLFPKIVREPRVVRAVDRISLQIYPGEIVGLVGESGSGKTTLGRCLIDLISPTSGSVTINGENLLHAEAQRKKELLREAQIIFQNPDSSLNPRRNVRELIGRPLELIGVTGTAQQKRVDELLDLVRLDKSYAERFPHQMSGGEKQRIGIARALATNPKFIVCDEAVSALDVSVQASVLNLLLDLRDELQIAYLFITHDLSVVSYIADRICVMRHGQIVEEGATEALLTSAQHPYTQKLLSAVPHVIQGQGLA